MYSGLLFVFLLYGLSDIYLLMWRNKRKREKGTSSEKTQYMSRVEKEYLKPDYSASIGEELEDGLFDGNPCFIFFLKILHEF